MDHDGNAGACFGMFHVVLSGYEDLGEKLPETGLDGK